jgi:DNA-binding transcriptional LysR family regulator
MDSSFLTLEDIPVFLAFASSPSAAAGAARVGLSQPAFNERLRRLEAELKPSPFSWQGNKRVLNDFGKRLLKALEPQLQSLRFCMEDVLANELEFVHGPLRVAGRNEIFSRLSEGFSRFSQAMILQTCSSHEALERVQKGEVDVAISVIRPQNPHLIMRRLFVSRAVLVVPKAFLSEARGSRSIERSMWGSLKARPWFAYQEQDSLFVEFLKLAGWSRGDIDLRVCCDDWQVLWRFVKAGLGCAVLPAAYVEDHPMVLVSQPADAFQNNPFYLVARKEKAQTARVREFFEFAKESLA